jgi:hypothetical protein
MIRKGRILSSGGNALPALTRPRLNRVGRFAAPRETRNKNHRIRLEDDSAYSGIKRLPPVEIFIVGRAFQKNLLVFQRVPILFFETGAVIVRIAALLMLFLKKANLLPLPGNRLPVTLAKTISFRKSKIKKSNPSGRDRRAKAEIRIPRQIPAKLINPRNCWIS